jgi:hypothetical protein
MLRSEIWIIVKSQKSICSSDNSCIFFTKELNIVLKELIWEFKVYVLFFKMATE